MWTFVNDLLWTHVSAVKWILLNTTLIRTLRRPAVCNYVEELISRPDVRVGMEITVGVVIPLCIYLCFALGFRVCFKHILKTCLQLTFFVLNICVVVDFFFIDLVIYNYEISHNTTLSKEEILQIYLFIHTHFAMWRSSKYANWEPRVCELLICCFLGGILAFVRSVNQDQINQYNLQIRGEVCQQASDYVNDCSDWYDWSIGFILKQWTTRWYVYFIDRVWYFEVQAVSLTFFWIVIEKSFKMIKSVVWFCLFFWRRKQNNV